MSQDQRTANEQAALEAALPALRPELHRYCARMTGSVIDGEDILQETLTLAIQALQSGAEVEDLRAWLFRIAHNTSVSVFRRQKRETVMKEEMQSSAPAHDVMPRHSETADQLRPFLSMTPKQRSVCILRDVLGYSAAEVADLTDSSVQSVKSALHRGRQLLENRNHEAFEPLNETEQSKLKRYARLFNDHAFDELRDILSEEVRLELVDRDARRGRAAVGGYFTNYGNSDDWIMAPGTVEGRAAILAFDRADPSSSPNYFVLLGFDGSKVLTIRDFRYARYAMTEAQWARIEM